MYKTELHCHSKESSKYSRISARKIVKLYDEEGFSTIVFTEHLSENNLYKLRKKKWTKQIDHLFEGHDIAIEYAKKMELDIYILFGVEIKLKETYSDYLMFGVTKEILYEKEKMYELTLKELHKFCRENGIILIQAHPFRDSIKRAAFEDVDGFEGFNGCHDEISRNDKAMNYAINSGKIITSGSDTHCKKDIARGGIKTQSEIKTMEELVHTLLYENIILIKS